MKEEIVDVFIKTRTDEAFEQIYEKYYRLVFLVINNIVGDKEVSKELTSDTFFRVYKSIDTFKVGSRFQPWLTTIAKNLAINYLNRDKDKHVIYDEDIVLSAEEIEDYDASMDVINILEGKELDVVRLRIVDNYTYQEICDHLGINLSDAYRSFQSGIKKIKANINKE